MRVGVILPFSSASPATRALAGAMLKAAELALFDSGNRNILLMTADEGANPPKRRAAATKLLDQGAEIIVGPLFGASVSAVAPLARDRGVPVLAFSTERSVAGNGVYLLELPAAERSDARGRPTPPRRVTRISRPWCRARPMAM